MVADGAVFTFDVKPFLNSISAMWAALGKTTDNAKKMAASVSGALQNIGTTIGASVKHGIILTTGLMNKALVGFKGLQKEVFNQIPEVSQAFDIAKDVMFQNLFWPLRKEIMPLLIQMTTWVTEHRALFVQWGQAAANVFKAVVSLASELWTIFKVLVDTVGTAFNRAFNTNFRSFQEFLDVLSFKVVAVIMYFKLLAGQLKIDIQPFFDWFFEKVSEGITWFSAFIKKIVEIDGWAHTLEATMGLMGSAIEGLGGIFTTFLDKSAKFVKGIIEADENGNSLATVLESLTSTVKILSEFGKNAISGFFDGFIDATPRLMTGIRGIIDRFNELLREIGLDKSNSVYNVFNKLGQLMGTVLTDSIDTLSSVLQSLTGFIRDINAYPETGAFLESVYQSLLHISTISKEAITSFFAAFLEHLSPIIKPLNEMATAFQSILTALFGAEGDEANSFFTKLGAAVAMVSINAVEALASMMTSLASALTVIKGDSKTGELINNMFAIITTISATTADAISGLFRSLADSLPSLVTPLAGIAKSLGTLITTLNGNSGDDVANFFERLGTALGKVAAEVATGVDHMMASLVEFFKEIKANPDTAKLINSIFTAFEKLAAITRVAAENMFDGFLTAINKITTPARDLADSLNLILDVLLGTEKNGTAVGSVFNALGRILGSLVEGSVQTLAIVFSHLATFVEKAAGKNDVAGILDGIADGLVKLNAWRAERLDEVLTAFGGFLERHPPSGFADTISGIAGSLVTLAGKAWDGISGLFAGIGTTFDKAKGSTENLIKTIIDGLIELAGHVKVKEVFTALGVFLGTSIATGADDLTKIIKAVGDLGKELLSLENKKSLASIFEGLKESATILKNFVISGFLGIVEGIKPHITSILSEINKIIEAFNNLMKKIGMNDSEGVYKAFKQFGDWIGTGLVFTLQIIATRLSEITVFFQSIEALIAILTAKDEQEKDRATAMIQETNKGILGWAENRLKIMGLDKTWVGDLYYGIVDNPVTPGSNTSFRDAVTGNTGKSTPAKDALITKGGQIVQFDPNDNIIAMQHLENLTGARNRGGPSGNITINMGGVTVMVTEGDAENAGRRFADSMAARFRDQISDQLLREGY
jgi:hypothetical protein